MGQTLSEQFGRSCPKGCRLCPVVVHWLAISRFVWSPAFYSSFLQPYSASGDGYLWSAVSCRHRLCVLQIAGRGSSALFACTEISLNSMLAIGRCLCLASSQWRVEQTRLNNIAGPTIKDTRCSYLHWVLTIKTYDDQLSSAQWEPCSNQFTFIALLFYLDTLRIYLKGRIQIFALKLINLNWISFTF